MACQIKKKQNRAQVKVRVIPGALSSVVKVDYSALPELKSKRVLQEQFKLLYPRKKSGLRILWSIFVNLTKGDLFISWKELKSLLFLPLLNQQTLFEELRVLERLYQEEGFLDMKILYQLVRKQNSVELRLYPAPDSQNQYVYHDFIIDSHTPLAAADLKEALSAYKEKPYNPAGNQKILKKAAAIYDAHGCFLENSVVYTLFDGQQVNLHIELRDQSYPELRMVRTKSIGLNQALINHLLATSDLLPGKRLTKQKVDLLGALFRNSMRFEKLEFSCDEDVLEINLEPESAFKYLNLQGNLFSKLKVGAEIDNFDYKKLFRGKLPIGGGQKLSLGFITKDLKKSLKERGAFDVELLYQNPWILIGGKRFLLESKLFKGTKNPEAGEIFKDLSIESRMGYSWSSQQGRERRLELGGCLSQKAFTNFKVKKDPILLLNGTYKLAKVLLSYRSQQVSDHFYPQAGSQKNIDLVAAFSLVPATQSNQVNYVQAIGRWSFFQDLKELLGKRWVLQHQFLLGLAKQASEQTFLGGLFLTSNQSTKGSSSLDSYYANIPAAEERSASPIPLLFSHLFELRYSPSLHGKVYSYFFLHTGVGKKEWAHFSRDQFSFEGATGFGFRIKTPLGVIELSFFWNLKEGRPNFAFQIKKNHE